MCHNLLHDPKIFQLLYRIDEALAEEARATRCACGGKWHRADYPRKPRGCLRDFRMMKTRIDSSQRDRWALLRFAIIGPLLAAPPAPGELAPALAALAARTWRHPLTGEPV